MISSTADSRVVEEPRVTLFQLPVDRLTLAETVQSARTMAAGARPHQHVVLNAAKIVQSRRDPALRQVISSCDIVNADGMSVVWASRILGQPLPERVAGIDLFEALVAAAAEDRSPVYFLGAGPPVVEQVVRVFQSRHPGLVVAGFHHGYWDDDDDIVAQVRESGARYLFLAIPSPRKEFWLKAHIADLGVPFVMGVGGSFDVVAGNVSRAPRLLQRAGLEWAWRLGQEPQRMWKRYLIGNTTFAWMTVVAYWKSKR